MDFSVYLARQPIFDPAGTIFAYELLYRDTGDNNADVADNLYATARVLVNTLNYIGLNTLTQGHTAFIKVDENILSDDIMDAISPAYFVLEILENASITPEVTDKIKTLSDSGYRFALNHYRSGTDFLERFNSILPMIDYVKVDLNQIPEAGQVLESLKRYNIRFIAEKIETEAQLKAAKELGFDYFQGYYFCLPDLMKKESFDPDSTLLLDLIYLLKVNAPLDELLDKFDTSPYLMINLLKFIQLHEGLSKNAIASLEQALVLIGRERLSSWLELMFYADGDRNVFETNARAKQVTQQALQRACLMEELAYSSKKSIRFADTAYITGILSISEMMYEGGTQELLEQIKVDKHISEALLFKKGELGKLLKLVIAVEKNDAVLTNALVLELDISQRELSNCLLNSYRRSSASPQYPVHSRL